MASASLLVFLPDFTRPLTASSSFSVGIRFMAAAINAGLAENCCVRGT
jgi:hypothetical protein